MPTASSDSHHPHDAFFKEVFSELANTRDLIRRYAPSTLLQHIDLDTLERYDMSFVDDELGQHFADLVFRVALKRGDNTFVCLLFEHKSYPDRWVALQLLRYIVRVWEHLDKKKLKFLPMVFPMVVYHGKRKWRVKHDLRALVNLKGMEALVQYVPNFEYYLFDLNLLDDAKLDEAGMVNVALGAMKHIFDDDMRSALGWLLRQVRAIPQAERERYITILLRYLATGAPHLRRADMSEVLRDQVHDVTLEEGMMTLAQQWILEGEARGKQVGLLEGKQAGLIEGEARGKRVGLSEMTKRLFQRRFKTLPDDIARELDRLSAEQLTNFGEALLDFSTIAQVRAWLAISNQPISQN